MPHEPGHVGPLGPQGPAGGYGLDDGDFDPNPALTSYLMSLGLSEDEARSFPFLPASIQRQLLGEDGGGGGGGPSQLDYDIFAYEQERDRLNREHDRLVADRDFFLQAGRDQLARQTEQRIAQNERRQLELEQERIALERELGRGGLDVQRDRLALDERIADVDERIAEGRLALDRFIAEGDLELARQQEDRLNRDLDLRSRLEQRRQDIELGGIEAGLFGEELRAALGARETGAGLLAQLAGIDLQRSQEIARLRANPRDFVQSQLALAQGGTAPTLFSQLAAGQPITGQSALIPAGAPPLLGQGFQDTLRAVQGQGAFEQALRAAAGLGSEFGVPRRPDLSPGRFGSLDLRGGGPRPLPTTPPRLSPREEAQQAFSSGVSFPEIFRRLREVQPLTPRRFAQGGSVLSHLRGAGLPDGVAQEIANRPGDLRRHLESFNREMITDEPIVGLGLRSGRPRFTLGEEGPEELRIVPFAAGGLIRTQGPPSVRPVAFPTVGGAAPTRRPVGRPTIAPVVAGPRPGLPTTVQRPRPAPPPLPPPVSQPPPGAPPFRPGSPERPPPTLPPPPPMGEAPGLPVATTPAPPPPDVRPIEVQQHEWLDDLQERINMGGTVTGADAQMAAQLGLFGIADTLVAISTGTLHADRWLSREGFERINRNRTDRLSPDMVVLFDQIVRESNRTFEGGHPRGDLAGAPPTLPGAPPPAAPPGAPPAAAPPAVFIVPAGDDPSQYTIPSGATVVQAVVGQNYTEGLPVGTLILGPGGGPGTYLVSPAGPGSTGRFATPGSVHSAADMAAFVAVRPEFAGAFTPFGNGFMFGSSTGVPSGGSPAPAGGLLGGLFGRPGDPPPSLQEIARAITPEVLATMTPSQIALLESEISAMGIEPSDWWFSYFSTYPEANPGLILTGTGGI